jgi:hypothetical protein
MQRLLAKACVTLKIISIEEVVSEVIGYPVMELISAYNNETLNVKEAN